MGGFQEQETSISRSYTKRIPSLRVQSHGWQLSRLALVIAVKTSWTGFDYVLAVVCIYMVVVVVVIGHAWPQVKGRKVYE